MASALGVLKWPPDTFWKATMREYTAAMKGHMLSKGVKLDGGVDRSEFLEMVREDEAREKLKGKQEA